MRFIELKLCEKVGNILAECNKEYTNSIVLCRHWLTSEVFAQIIAGDPVMCSQAKSYIAKCFLEENKNVQNEQGNTMRVQNELLYWIGYVFAYWCLEYGENPRNIQKNYGIEQMLLSYATLHTLSIKTAIEKIKEDCFCG